MKETELKQRKQEGQKQERRNDADDTQRREAHGNWSSENSDGSKASLRDTGPLQQHPSPPSLCTQSTSPLKELYVRVHARSSFQDTSAPPCLHPVVVTESKSPVFPLLTVSPLTQTSHLLVCGSEDLSLPLAKPVAGHLFPDDLSAAFTHSKSPAEAYLHSRSCTGTTRLKITH